MMGERGVAVDHTTVYQWTQRYAPELEVRRLLQHPLAGRPSWPPNTRSGQGRPAERHRLGRMNDAAACLITVVQYKESLVAYLRHHPYKRGRRYMAIELLDLASEHQNFGNLGESADALYGLVERLYPICRSITGEGVRQTLRILGEYIPIAVHEVPTGTPVFDWEVPKEWNIRDAYIEDESGRRVVDFKSNNLHVVSYSTPVRATLSLEELKPHLHTLPDHPNWIPYRTSYWKEYWGFCLPHNLLLEMRDARYDVSIDSTLQNGHLTYAEYLVAGKSEEEVLLFSHTCHPSMCNDNCSGLAVTTFLARRLSELSPRYSYRFVWAPGTIGSLTWLSRNKDAVARIRHGLVLTGLGDPGPFTYKRSRRGNAVIDRIVSHVILGRNAHARIDDFSVYGYDERQFCSPGFDLPVGRLTRTPYGEYAEYHTSADDLNFIAPERLGEALAILLQIVDGIESSERCYVNTCPYGEPRLGKRGLFRSTGGAGLSRREEALLWMLNLSDGSHSVIDIAERSKIDFPTLAAAIADLIDCELLVENRTYT
jgi:aminopeptidase-like protein